MPNFISEDDIERALLKKLSTAYGYEVLNCYTVEPEDLNDRSNRTDKRDVILVDRLKRAALRLNPQIPEDVIDEAVTRFCDRRSAMTLIAANRELDGLIRDGIPVEYENPDGAKETERLKLIDFDQPDPAAGRNEYLAVSQLWVKAQHNSLRPDVILYVNGLPLVFIELKNSNVDVETAYTDNLRRYKADIPQLFHANAVCILSNGLETRIGSITSQWEHFFKWLRPDDEHAKVDPKQLKETDISLELAAEGLCAPARLLDYMENYVLYHNETTKITAQNQQFLGVNQTFEAFQNRKALKGKLGVFWHTQGSGKSFSMIFLVRKISRKLTGNFTFVVVTDRDDLDGQIYRNFLNTGTVTKSEAARPKNSAEMRKFLSQNKRLVFTLIHKFRFDKGKNYPVLSTRDDVVVIVDEAHRTQYKTLAENMRAGLPQANYLAFTGTPLLGKDRKTSAWFGGYVSEYNYQQSVDDGATVPLFYQKRVPEVLIQNDDLADEFLVILEDENLDEAKREKLENKFAKEIEVIKRDDRLDRIAQDIVYHFPRRGYLGKGMVITVDKFTAVTMYDKVQRLWKEELRLLVGKIAAATDPKEKERLRQVRAYMDRAQMAVVISEETGEDKSFAEEGLDIKPHRDRINRLDAHGHDIEYNFKNASDPLQLVFVCAMWLTGFDAPTLSTLYIDKPMKDHTLMQTITRANRVTSWRINGVPKKKGELIDYYNVFRNMKEALKNYAQGEEGLGEVPVKDMSALFDLLEDAIAEGLAFCRKHDVPLEEVLDRQDVFVKLGKFEEYANTLLANDDTRKKFIVYQNTITGLYEACKPDILEQKKGRLVSAFEYLRGVIDSHTGEGDVDAASQRIASLLDQSVVVAGSNEAGEDPKHFGGIHRGRTLDLSKLDFAKLNAEFKEAPHKNIQIAEMRAFIEHKLAQMLSENSTRSDFAERFQRVIDKYNAGGSATENSFDELIRFTKDLREEDERHLREGLKKDELEIYDLLRKDGLTKEESQKVKLAAQALLERLTKGKPKVLVQDWYKDNQTQLQVKSAVAAILDSHLPDTYDRDTFRRKCDTVYDLAVNLSSHGLKWGQPGRNVS